MFRLKRPGGSSSVCATTGTSLKTIASTPRRASGWRHWKSGRKAMSTRSTKLCLVFQLAANGSNAEPALLTLVRQQKEGENTVVHTGCACFGLPPARQGRATAVCPRRECHRLHGGRIEFLDYVSPGREGIFPAWRSRKIILAYLEQCMAQRRLPGRGDDRNAPSGQVKGGEIAGGKSSLQRCSNYSAPDSDSGPRRDGCFQITASQSDR